ncbi:MAG TPA: thiolase family protein, partial [Smithellaceae bacterium]|nr:thiolase family protein [Smithellaceae bacterium]
RAGFPVTTISMTVDRACCSSMTALHLAYKAIKSGEISIAIAAGAENLSNVPYLVNGLRWGKRLGHVMMVDQLDAVGYAGWNPVSMDASEVALEYGVTREDQDKWALQSQQRYARAKEEGKFRDEIVPYVIKDPKGNTIILSEDQSPRPDTTLEKLAKLPTVYNTPTVTAGNAPGLSAGAAAIVVMSEEKAKELALQPLAYVCDVASVADEARKIPCVPAGAIRKLIARNNMTLDDLDLIEINEAFAAMPLVSTKILADGDSKKLARLRNITNVNGGAVALGHPMGASGARIIMTLMYELRRRGGGIGIAAICGGLAQGDGVMIECRKKV